MYVRTSELRHLDVINLEDGRVLGNVCDVDLDPDTGALRCLVLERAESGFMRFFKHNDLEIPWEEVVMVGVDVVIVRTKLDQTSHYRAWQRARF